MTFDIETQSNASFEKQSDCQPDDFRDSNTEISIVQPTSESAGSPDNNETIDYLRMIHAYAGELNGKIIVTSFGEDPKKKKGLKPKITHHEIGAFKKTVQSVQRLSKENHRNVYLPLAIMRDDLASGKKGGKTDVHAVLGLVMDFDAKDGGADDWEGRLKPFEPTMVLRTSTLPEASYQCFFIFDDPLEPAQAQRLATMLTDHCDCDHGSKDISHVWRIPGTQNWPNLKKIRDHQRPPTPQRVKTIIPYAAARLINADHMDAALTVLVSPETHMPTPASAPLKAVRKSKIDFKNLPEIDLDNLWSLGGVCENVPATIRKIILDAEHPFEPDRYESRSEAVFAVACSLARHQIPDEIIAAILLNREYQISEHIYDQKQPHEYTGRQICQAKEKIAVEPLHLSPKKPRESARHFLLQNQQNLMHYNGDFLSYDGAAYISLETGTIRSDISAFLEKAVQKPANSDAIISFDPTIAKINEVLDALKSLTHRPKNQFAPPCWLDQNDLAPNEILSCRNGLLHLPTNELLANSPQFFTFNALDFEYQPEAPQPQRWLSFLASLWPSDPDSIHLLQELFGYLLVPDTSQHKIFMMVGPPRSGKGTITRILTRLVGEQNVCSPTLKSMSTQFGLQPLIGKQIATISDMRVGRSTDLASVSENLLRISGEDRVTIDRKNVSVWEGTLSTRFLGCEPNSVR